MPEPRPHPSPRHYEPIDWPSGTRRPLSPFPGSLEVDFVQLLEQRQTRRHFAGTLTDADLGSFLWLACRNRSLRPGPFGAPQESRPHPSAGGMHPIHVLTARAGEPWYRYDPIEHCLVEVVDTALAARKARDTSDKLVHLQGGVLLGLAAEPGKTGAKYEHPESLVWRDAGVLLGYMSLVAEAMQLAFCPLGSIGDADFGSATTTPARLHPAGLAVLGRPRL
jgi:SagB-type dehydrogenase family enzyme